MYVVIDKQIYSKNAIKIVNRFGDLTNSVFLSHF
jgi:hypothetical protein